MKCPTCNVSLVMSERQGIEIDYCPQCRGVWLDRGELDKIIEFSNNETHGPAGQRNLGNPYQQGQQPHFGQQKYYRKKHWLNELFD